MLLFTFLPLKPLEPLIPWNHTVNFACFLSSLAMMSMFNRYQIAKKWHHLYVLRIIICLMCFVRQWFYWHMISLNLRIFTSFVLQHNKMSVVFRFLNQQFLCQLDYVCKVSYHLNHSSGLINNTFTVYKLKYDQIHWAETRNAYNDDNISINFVTCTLQYILTA